MGDERGGVPRHGAAARGWLTRLEVARRLHVGKSTVRRLEDSGRLKPVLGDDGAFRFDPAEIARIEAERSPKAAGSDDVSGEAAARIFPLFEAGVPFAEIVVQTRAAPAAVRALYREWRYGFETPPAPEPDEPEVVDRFSATDDDKTFEKWRAELRAAWRRGRRPAEERDASARPGQRETRTARSLGRR